MSHRPLPTEPLPAPLEALEPSPSVSPAGAFVATCLAEAHPTLAGRVLCRLPSGLERWVPCLVGVRPREGDDVVVQHAEGAPEGFVAGVLSGLRPRVEPEPLVRHRRSLREDEVVRIEGDDGTPLLEIGTPGGVPTVRFLSPDVRLAAPGKLTLDAEALELRARKGEVRVQASDDVVVLGEHIHLN